jgi:hypothetical protein
MVMIISPSMPCSPYPSFGFTCSFLDQDGQPGNTTGLFPGPACCGSALFFTFGKVRKNVLEIRGSRADVSANVRGKGTIVKRSLTAVLVARTIGLCLFGATFGSCGTERTDPPLPEEFFPEREADDAADVRSENVSVLGSITLEQNRPVDSSTDTIIYTPAEEPQKVPVLTNCTNQYQISASTNPFLAGMPNNSTINYPNSSDRVPRNAPVQLTATDPQCMEPGRAIYFKVDGRIAFDDGANKESNADGIATKVVQHTLGNTNRIAMTAAPINSLIGVFLDATPTNQRSATAPQLDFRSAEKRDFKMLAPAIGQIFFIGDGKDSTGAMQAFMVPQGATRLYVAIMDEYEWNNNIGNLTVTATWLKP